MYLVINKLPKNAGKMVMKYIQFGTACANYPAWPK